MLKNLTRFVRFLLALPPSNHDYFQVSNFALLARVRMCAQLALLTTTVLSLPGTGCSKNQAFFGSDNMFSVHHRLWTRLWCPVASLKEDDAGPVFGSQPRRSATWVSALLTPVMLPVAQSANF